MSNSLAIATVTEAFRQQIQKALTDDESETGISGALVESPASDGHHQWSPNWRIKCLCRAVPVSGHPQHSLAQ